ncbi:MAG: hypothetical protein WC314_17945 [Vulcanimicrobiota bacterium]
MRPYSFARSSPRAARGTTLVELSIVSGLLLIISLAMAMVVRNAVDFYHSTNATLDAQQGVLFGISRLSQELAESHRDTLLVQQGADTGIIFASPRGEDDNYEFDSFGRLRWQKFICYYLGKVGEPEREISALMRKSEMLTGSPPVRPPDPGGRTVGTFAPGAPTRVVGRYVTGFEIKTAQEVTAEDEKLDNAFGNRVLQIKLTATTDYRNSFSVESETSVVLRN